MRSELERLKNELFSARRAILELVPGEIERELHGYYECRTPADVQVWLSETAGKVIALAAIENPDAVYDSPRARCPLCQRGASDGYGFAVPEGLRRHLLGWGNVRQCVVTETAWKLAREHAKER